MKTTKKILLTLCLFLFLLAPSKSEVEVSCTVVDKDQDFYFNWGNIMMCTTYTVKCKVGDKTTTNVSTSCVTLSDGFE